MSNKSTASVATMGIDIGNYSFHVVGLDERGAIVRRQKWSRSQVEARLANMPPCLTGMEACVARIAGSPIGPRRERRIELAVLWQRRRRSWTALDLFSCHLAANGDRLIVGRRGVPI